MNIWQKIKSYIPFGMKDFLGFIIILIIISVIPLTVFLVKHEQVIKSRAADVTFNNAGKLGLQIACGYPNQVEFEALMAQHPNVIKLMDDVSCASRIKQISPATFIVARIYEVTQVVDDQPETRAQEWFDRNQTKIMSTAGVDCWEGYNEPDISTTEKMGWYARLEKRRVDLLSGINRKACIGNFSNGWPQAPELDGGAFWSAFRPALEAAQAQGGFLALHEYSAPDMKCQFDSGNQKGWLTGRYRRAYNDYLIPQGLAIPLVITETGMTGAVCSICGCNITTDVGWKSLSVSASSYTNELKWYDFLLQADSYVKGATIFISGSGNWSSFETYPDIIGPQGLLISYGGQSMGILCNSVTLSASPANVGPSQNITFAIVGNASTYIRDDYGGGAIGCSGSWNNKTCQATSSLGQHTWTHYWKNCQGGLDNCSQECSSSTSYNISSTTSTFTPSPSPRLSPTPTIKITPSPTSTSRPSATPTSTPTPTPKQGFFPTSTATITPTKRLFPTSTKTPTPTPFNPASLSDSIPQLNLNLSKYDINQDGVVNSIDVGNLLNAWRDFSSGNIGRFDFNSDTTINSMDYSMMVNNINY